MRKYVLLVAALLVVAAEGHAQQSSAVNEAVASDIGRLVIQNNSLQVERNGLQTALRQAQERVKELEAKYEPKKEEPAK
jgi:uncharacterized protein YlxW (UPF0749 family)